MRVVKKYHNRTKNKVGHEILKIIMGLTHLPPERMREGINYVWKLVHTNLPEKDWPKWEKLINEYFEREWMHIVGPKHFSNFRALERTDNKSESSNARLNALVGKNPKVPVLLGKNTSLSTS